MRGAGPDDGLLRFSYISWFPGGNERAGGGRVLISEIGPFQERCLLLLDAGDKLKRLLKGTYHNASEE